MTAKLDARTEQQIIELFLQGVPKIDIARQVGCWAGTVLDILRRNDIDSTPMPEQHPQRIMDAVEISYLAGLIDGEGSIYLIGGKHPQIKVSMCDEEVINSLFATTAVGIVRKNPTPRNPRWSQSWCWEVSRKKDVARILLAIYPLLRVAGRKNQVTAALEVW